jgi:DNA-binding NarL/FixJ family response regulator
MAISRVTAPGMPEHQLIICSAPQRDFEDRVQRAVREWKLTARQAEVLREVVSGKSNKGIAEKLRCGESTVEYHVTKLLRSARVENRAAFVAKFWSVSFR